MIKLMCAGMLALLLAGCHHGTLVVEDRGANDNRYWDGSVWVVSSDHRGHYRHHGGWHKYPENHVYVQPHHAHFGVTINRSNDRHDNRPNDRRPSRPGGRGHGGGHR